MDFALSAEHSLLREAAAEFAAREIAPRAAERDREAAFPTEELAAAARQGLLGLLIPEQFGGIAVGALGAAVVYEELARVSPSLSVILSVHNSLVSQAVDRFGEPTVRERFLPELAGGERLGSYALTESQAGSDAAAIQTAAVRDGENYRITGRKMFITSGAHAGLIVVFAVTDPEARTSRRISTFAVEAERAGVRAVRSERKLGLRASEIVELEFSDVRVPAEQRLGAEGEGFGIAMSLLDGGRIGIGAQSVGIAQGAMDRALAYAAERKQFGQPIGQFQSVQNKLADMSTRIEAARLLVYRAAWFRDNGHEHGLTASQAKLFASETAVAVADEAVQIHGGYGYLEEYEVERYLRDARATTLYEGTSEIQRMVIARRLLAGQRGGVEGR